MCQGSCLHDRFVAIQQMIGIGARIGRQVRDFPRIHTKHIVKLLDLAQRSTSFAVGLKDEIHIDQQLKTTNLEIGDRQSLRQCRYPCLTERGFDRKHLKLQHLRTRFEVLRRAGQVHQRHLFEDVSYTTGADEKIVGSKRHTNVRVAREHFDRRDVHREVKLKRQS